MTMHFVKVIVFSGLEVDFDVWKMRFEAFCTKQGYDPTLDDLADASEEMQLELYTSMVLDLTEDDLSHIEGFQVWLPRLASSHEPLRELWTF